jgi:hypothetical protein
MKIERGSRNTELILNIINTVRHNYEQDFKLSSDISSKTGKIRVSRGDIYMHHSLLGGNDS